MTTGRNDVAKHAEIGRRLGVTHHRVTALLRVRGGLAPSDARQPVQLDVALCLPQEAATIALIRSITSDALVKLGVTPECVDDIRLALSEACTNVIDHAAAGDEYEVRLQVDDENCQIRVVNTGDGFDAEALSDDMPDAGSARGRGVAIMRAVMDHVAFRSEAEAGTIVHLTKALELVPGGPLDRLRPTS